MANGKRKGNTFERAICKALSLWWTSGEREDVFWRSASSGGVATQRHKVGKTMYGQSGDIQAIDPIGAPLLQLMTVELKRGYTTTSFADALDKPARNKPCVFEGFVSQCSFEAKTAGTPFWLLIVQRNRRKALVFVPTALYKRLCIKPRPPVSAKIDICRDDVNARRIRVVCVPFDDFLAGVSPAAICTLNSAIHVQQ